MSRFSRVRDLQDRGGYTERQGCHTLSKSAFSFCLDRGFLVSSCLNQQWTSHLILLLVQLFFPPLLFTSMTWAKTQSLQVLSLNMFTELRAILLQTVCSTFASVSSQKLADSIKLLNKSLVCPLTDCCFNLTFALFAFRRLFFHVAWGDRTLIIIIQVYPALCTVFYDTQKLWDILRRGQNRGLATGTKGQGVNDTSVFVKRHGTTMQKHEKQAEAENLKDK